MCIQCVLADARSHVGACYLHLLQRVVSHRSNFTSLLGKTDLIKNEKDYFRECNENLLLLLFLARCRSLSLKSCVLA